MGGRPIEELLVLGNMLVGDERSTVVTTEIGTANIDLGMLYRRLEAPTLEGLDLDPQLRASIDCCYLVYVQLVPYRTPRL